MIKWLTIILLACASASAQQTEVNTARSIRLKGFRLWMAPEPAWSPANMPNLFGWWKADTITNLVNGSEVAYWIDSSGHNLHMRPDAIGTAPYYTNGFANAKPAVFFDGVNDYMTNAAAMGQTNCFFFVIRHMIPSTSDSYLFETASTDEPPGLGAFGSAQYFRWQSSIYTNGVAYAGAGMTVTNSLTNTVTTYIVQFAANSGRVWTNGVPAMDEGASGTLSMNGMRVGTSMAVNNYFKGHLLEMGGLTNAFISSGTTLADLTTYLKNKYGHH